MNSSKFNEVPSLWTGGPDPAGLHSFPNKRPASVLMHSTSNKGATTRSAYPITTGTSVFGIKFNGGVVLAADTLGSYGSLARYTDVQRVIKINESTVVACSGDIADFEVSSKLKDRKVNN